MEFVQLPESVVLFLFPNLVSLSHDFFEYSFSLTLYPFIMGSSGTNVRSFPVAPQIHQALFLGFVLFFFSSLFSLCCSDWALSIIQFIDSLLHPFHSGVEHIQ